MILSRAHYQQEQCLRNPSSQIKRQERLHFLKVWQSRNLFQVVQTQTVAANCGVLPRFRAVQTQIKTAYCRILPTLDHHI